MGHWYSQDGKPQHFTNGRDTTLRDARKHGYYPSVTTILGSLDKPGLNRWKEQQVLLAALTLPKIENEPLDKFSKRVMYDAFKESTEARDRGSEIHNCMENWWLDMPLHGAPSIESIARQACMQISDYCENPKLFIPEQTVVGSGYGGMIDLHNDDFVIDYKTKDIKDIKTKMAYPEHCMQLAAYDRALSCDYILIHNDAVEKWERVNPRRLINVFVDRTEPGKVVIHEWKPEEANRAWQQFELLVEYWQLSKNYFPDKE